MSNKWLIPYNKLDTDQRRFIDRCYGDGRNYWISGFAGSGKSVLLCYAIKRAIEENKSIYIVTFTHSLIAMFKAALGELGVEVNGRIGTIYQFQKTKGNYGCVLCDEVQDLPREYIEEMRSRCNLLYVAGDERQSIYDRDPKRHLLTVSSDEIAPAAGAETFRLSIVHRLGPKLKKAAESLLGDRLFTDTAQASDEDAEIKLKPCSGAENEVRYIWKEAKRHAGVGESSCILVPTQEKAVSVANMILRAEGKEAWSMVLNDRDKPDYGALNSHCSDIGVRLQYVGNSYGSFSENYNGVYLMTYHSSKGLDFDNVFIPFVDRNMNVEKVVFFVAITRTRKNLFITYSGSRHPYLNTFPRDTYGEVADLGGIGSGGGFSF